jgi:soluble lytic murein transglycosylase-like protein
VAAEAAQIQQESGWNPAAHSSVADGLTEFTPGTATWISGAYPKLGPPAPYNPAWALRALVTYDRDLWEKTQPPPAAVTPATDCDHMAFAFSAYNGGIGWVYRDQALAKSFKADPSRWWRGVEFFSRRSAAATKENRGYPRRILLTLMPAYLGWGPGVDCSAVAP